MTELTQEYFWSVFKYKEGRLYWRQIPLDVLGRPIPRKLTSDAGHAMSHGYRGISFHGKVVSEHRLIFFMHHGYWPRQVDHDNSDRQDNRIENLFDRSQMENVRKARRKSTNTSGVTGVSWCRTVSKWRAMIHVNKRRVSLGRYKEFAEAVKARREAEDKYFGDCIPVDRDEHQLKHLNS
jgi:hypothetical protein